MTCCGSAIQELGVQRCCIASRSCLGVRFAQVRSHAVSFKDLVETFWAGAYFSKKVQFTVEQERLATSPQSAFALPEALEWDWRIK